MKQTVSTLKICTQSSLKKYIGFRQYSVQLPSLVRGTKDLFPDQCQVRYNTVEKCRRVSELHGFQEIATPIVEFSDLYCRSLGDDSDIVMKEMFSFKDKSDNLITLRPEGTAGVARAYLNAKMNLTQKYYYFGEMFRYERPQRGRQRQFHQFGVEYIGSSSPLADVEVIYMAHQILHQLSLTSSIRLEVNTIGDDESRNSYRQSLLEYFTNYQSDLSTDSKNRLERGSVLRILDSKDEKDFKIIETAPIFTPYLSKTALNRFDQVLEGLESLNIPFTINQRLVRGLDYYDHSTFEFIECGDGARELTVLAGGRYDRLFHQMGNREIPAIGWAAGIDRLCLLSKNKELVSQSFSIAVIPMAKSTKSTQVNTIGLQIFQKMIAKGWKTHLCVGSSIRSQIKAADRFGASFAIVIGDSEVEKGHVSLKNLDLQTQQSIPLESLEKNLSDILWLNSTKTTS